MNKKGIGIIPIIFGCYLLVGNTIFSLLFNYPGPIGWGIPISPSDYWRNWWNNNGLVTVIIAVAGLLLLIQGIRILIRNNKRTLIITESN
ncbi:MAG: hypothetical protein KGD74_06300 [Candidatus Lokiarchaeota archaeon]|nr:hypothetical protein [Candidatus Lokiarchaeota archaeon]